MEQGGTRRRPLKTGAATCPTKRRGEPTAYGVLVQACWAQHKRQYPDEVIHKEIEEFYKDCPVCWYNLS